jgi:hypothetical protein
MSIPESVNIDRAHGRELRRTILPPSPLFPGCDGQVAHLPALRYLGEGRKEFEVKRSKVEPERLISFLQDWFGRPMDLV